LKIINIVIYLLKLVEGQNKVYKNTKLTSYGTKKMNYEI